MCVDIYIYIERERDEERERAREIDKFPPNIVEFLFSETGEDACACDAAESRRTRTKALRATN